MYHVAKALEQHANESGFQEEFKSILDDHSTIPVSGKEDLTAGLFLTPSLHEVSCSLLLQLSGAYYKVVRTLDSA